MLKGEQRNERGENNVGCDWLDPCKTLWKHFNFRQAWHKVALSFDLVIFKYCLIYSMLKAVNSHEHPTYNRALMN